MSSRGGIRHRSLLSKMTEMQRARAYQSQEGATGQEQYNKFKSYKQYAFYITEMFNAPSSYALRQSRERAARRVRKIEKKFISQGDNAEIMETLGIMNHIAENKNTSANEANEEIRRMFNQFGATVSGMSPAEVARGRSNRSKEVRRQAKIMKEHLKAMAAVRGIAEASAKKTAEDRISTLTSYNKYAIEGYHKLLRMIGEVQSGALTSKYIDVGTDTGRSYAYAKMTGEEPIFKNIAKKMNKIYGEHIASEVQRNAQQILGAAMKEVEDMLKAELRQKGVKNTRHLDIVMNRTNKNATFYETGENPLVVLHKGRTLARNVLEEAGQYSNKRYQRGGITMASGTYDTMKSLTNVNLHPLTATVLANTGRFEHHITPDGGKFLFDDELTKSESINSRPYSDAVRVIQQWVYDAASLYLGSDHVGLAQSQDAYSIFKQWDKILTQEAYLGASFEGSRIHIKYYQ